jgi:NADPH:quinone reductase-like Zn-dependent oxidoreductase
MKAIVVTDKAAGTAGMALVERPEPEPAINDVVVQVSCVGIHLGRADVALDLDRSPRP